MTRYFTILLSASFQSSTVVILKTMRKEGSQNKVMIDVSRIIPIATDILDKMAFLNMSVSCIHLNSHLGLFS